MKLEQQINNFKTYRLNDLKKIDLKLKPKTRVDIVSGKDDDHNLNEIKNELIQEGVKMYHWKKSGKKEKYPTKLMQFHKGGFVKKGNEKGKYAKWAFKIPIFKESK
tara:strand:- start:85 stop:402 length:318 start_codon:yes stop_codon:yes gene_type:complete